MQNPTYLFILLLIHNIDNLFIIKFLVNLLIFRSHWTHRHRYLLGDDGNRCYSEIIYLTCAMLSRLADILGSLYLQLVCWLLREGIKIVISFSRKISCILAKYKYSYFIFSRSYNSLAHNCVCDMFKMVSRESWIMIMRSVEI